MSADEKSDKVVVPKKQPNNESLLSAEDVEERTLPRRNTGQSTAVRYRVTGIPTATCNDCRYYLHSKNCTK